MGIVLVVVGLAVLVLLGAGMLWQERLGFTGPEVVYDVEAANRYVWERLPEGARARLRRADVRRMLEWAVRWMQLDPDERGVPAVFGSVELAEYVQERCWRRGHAYEPEDVLAVVELQARYVAELGALGAAAGDGP
ncbi:MAG TPA: hypothetical protein ENK55_12295 [Actinobacteria bacterium]|nr:hypothetical protein [Actinomycetota bacterium]